MKRQPFYPFRSEQDEIEYKAYYQERAKAWPIPFETLFLDTASGTTLVRASGHATNPPLVLLPGVRVSSLMWSHSITALAAHHRTYALDILGDAGPSVSRRESLEPDDLTRWLDEVFAVLVSEGQLSLMGISYGGLLAGRYALRFPGRVRSVVLLAPAGLVLQLSFTFFLRVTLLSLSVPGVSGAPLARVLRWLSPDAAEGDDACRARLEQAISDVQMGLRHSVLPAPAWPKALDDETWRGFSVPCLFVVGEKERIYSARAAVRRLSRVAPQVKTEIIPGAGHGLPLTQPDLIARKVLEFLAERESVAAPGVSQPY